MIKFITACTLAVVTPFTAVADQAICGQRDKVIASLSAKYHEQPVAVGVTSNGGIIEVLKSPDGDTWSILFTYPSGPTCFVASGQSWQELKGPSI